MFCNKKNYRNKRYLINIDLAVLLSSSVEITSNSCFVVILLNMSITNVYSWMPTYQWGGDTKKKMKIKVNKSKMIDELS